MKRSPGAEPATVPEPPKFQASASAFTAALVRFLRALAGLFGLELREASGEALLIGLLGLAFVVASVLAYLFLLIGLTVAVVSLLGGEWAAALLVIFALHALAAAVIFVLLRRRTTKTKVLFLGTREALRREVKKLS